MEVKGVDFDTVNAVAEGYRGDMTKFLGDPAKIPREGAEEGSKIARAKVEMEELGFNKIDVDPQGNSLDYMGSGEKLIAFDGHMDTVGTGEANSWKFGLYNGYETETETGGRGTSDQEGGVASAICGARIMRDLGLLSEKYTALVTVTTQEKDCDDLCWQYIIKEDGIHPEPVISARSTDGGTYRGQQGRMEIKVDVKGVLCHGSAPKHGGSATHKTADILQDVRALNSNGDTESTAIRGLARMLDPRYDLEWQEACFSGRGTMTISQIFHSPPSRCAVTDGCTVPLDHRMAVEETWENCSEEIHDLSAVEKYGDDMTVSMYDHDRPLYTDLTCEIECYFPAWVIPEDHDVTKALMETYKNLYGEIRKGSVETMETREERPLLDKWTFSTSGVSIMGRDGIPYIGFGLGTEAQAHVPNEKTWKDDLVRYAAVYVALPIVYCS